MEALKTSRKRISKNQKIDENQTFMIEISTILNESKK
jgi:hypothetical protein